MVEVLTRNLLTLFTVSQRFGTRKSAALQVSGSADAVGSVGSFRFVACCPVRED